MDEGNSQACAACLHQRRPCGPDCLLAKYFPASQQETYKKVDYFFGIGNVEKMIETTNDPQEREKYIQSVIAQANEYYQNNVNVDPRNGIDLNIGESSQPLVQPTNEYAHGNLGRGMPVRPFNPAQNAYGAWSSQPQVLNRTPQQPSSSGVFGRGNLGEGMHVRPFNQTRNMYVGQPLVQTSNDYGAVSLESLEALPDHQFFKWFLNTAQEPSSSTHGNFGRGMPVRPFNHTRNVYLGEGSKPLVQPSNEYGAMSLESLEALPNHQFFRCFLNTVQEPSSSTHGNLGRGMPVRPINQAQNAYGAWSSQPLVLNRTPRQPSSSGVFVGGNLGEGIYVRPYQAWFVYRPRSSPPVVLNCTLSCPESSQPMVLNWAPQQLSSSGVSARGILGVGTQVGPLNHARNVDAALENQHLNLNQPPQQPFRGDSNDREEEP